MAIGRETMQNTAGGILSYFTRHGTAANLLMVLLLVAGFVTLPKMRAQYFPDVVIDTVTVTVQWSGAGAEDVDKAIVQILEPALLAVEGVTGSTARSSEGSARVSLEFETDWDMDQAEKDVQDALDAINSFPDDTEDPVIRRSNWLDGVTDVVITGPVGVDQLSRFADDMIARLFEEGVTSTSIRGVVAPETLIEVTSISLMQYDVTLSEIAAAIAAEVNADPVGDVAGTARIRTGVEKRTAEDIANIVLRSGADFSELTVGDVATITVAGIDRDQSFYVGDNSAVQISVSRNARGDAIGIQATVEEVAADMVQTLPQGVSIDLVNTRAEQITGRLNLLMENGLMGLGLVLVLLFLFLNARTAFWVAMGIPISMLAAVTLMYVAGITINMISLFALIITLGIVVDDAIVVGEHADFRARVLGENGAVAAENAAKRMFGPVFSATITTNIAFYGLTIISGRFGEIISVIPFTVITVLTASLIECFIVLPHHLSHTVDTSKKDRWYDWPSRQVNRGFGWVRDRLFRPLMRWIVVLRYPVIAVSILLLASQMALFVRGEVQWRFFSAPEQGQVNGNFAMLATATRDDSLAMMAELQRATDAAAAAFEAETGVNPLKYVVTQIGGTTGRGLTGAENKETYQIGAISIELIDADLRPFASNDFVAAVQAEVVNHPQAETVSFRSFGAGPGGDSLSIELSGADADTLKAAAEALKTELSQFAEVSGLQDSLSYDKDEYVLELTPKGQALGFSIDALGSVLRQRLGGIEAASYPDGTRSATIRVQLPDQELTADFLERLQMRTASGIYVPLSDIVTVTTESGFSTVQRENGVMLISVSGDLADDDAERATEIKAIINDDILPDIQSRYGIETELGGLSEQENQFLSDAINGLIFVLAGIYLTLCWIFASWSRPMVVMAVIPFGLVGTIWGHYIWGVPLSMFSVVGLLGMVGIIINDSIVLVTTIDEYARERGRVPAIIDGTADRLRPVMLTTATTVIGLAPLLYEGSSQAEFLKPTVITLVYGLGFGMFIVLFMVPALLAIQLDFARLMGAMRMAIGARRRAISLPVNLAVGWTVALFAALVLPLAVGYGPLLPVLPDGLMSAVGLYLMLMIAGVLLILAATLVALGRRRV